MKLKQLLFKAKAKSHFVFDQPTKAWVIVYNDCMFKAIIFNPETKQILMAGPVSKVGYEDAITKLFGKLCPGETNAGGGY